MKMHVNLPTHDVKLSVEFFRTLLGVEPVKEFEDYALFVTDSPPLELALDANEEADQLVSTHFGIAVDEPHEVEAAIKRLQAAGHVVDVRDSEACCYAQQDKVWATDPDGRRWETYFVSDELVDRDGTRGDCCEQDRGTIESDKKAASY